MDNVSKKFDEWAINGKAESMEKGHGVNVLDRKSTRLNSSH